MNKGTRHQSQQRYELFKVRNRERDVGELVGSGLDPAMKLETFQQFACCNIQQQVVSNLASTCIIWPTHARTLKRQTAVLKRMCCLRWHTTQKRLLGVTDPWVEGLSLIFGSKYCDTGSCNFKGSWQRSIRLENADFMYQTDFGVRFYVWNQKSCGLCTEMTGHTTKPKPGTQRQSTSKDLNSW